jgi:CheY-like chemotaxis protein
LDTGSGHADAPLVLVVDDHEDGRQILSELLIAYGYRSVGLASAHEALAELDLLSPDAVIVDIGLPDMNGFELATTLRSRRDVPVVAYTGYADSRTYDQAREAGCCAVLVKCVGAKTILNTIRDVIARSA